MRITTVTLNPCMERTITVEEALGGANKVTRVQNDISVKGIHVGRVLKNLGADPLCLDFFCEKGASKLCGTLDGSGIRHGFVNTPASAEALLDNVESHFSETDILVLGGSVPQGVPSDIYRRLAERANERGIPTILDAAGELLLEGMEGRPCLVKLNIDELSRTRNREFRSRDEIVQGAREIVGKGVCYVCVSLGSEGAILVDETEVFFAPALELDVKGVRGAGDSMVAGFCLAMEKKESASNGLCPAPEKKKDMAALLRYAMACAAGSLVKEGTELCDREAFERFLPLVTVKKTDEFFDIRTSMGETTGRVKARSLVHRDGDWHGTAHMWVANRGEDGRWKLLIQRRSMDKDNFPGYLDISSAGHLSAGDDYDTAAYRELYEELGIRARDGDLKFLLFIGRQIKTCFHGQNVIDREVAAIYLYDKPVQISDLHLQKEEVEEVFWMDIDELMAAIEDPEKKYCIYGGELRKLKKYLEKL